MTEPKEAFPYRAPSADLKLKYKHIFDLDGELPRKFLKVIFDKILAIVLLILVLPILLIIKIGFIIEGFLVPENSGPMFFYYNAVSAGKIIPKYKIRLIKQKFIDFEGARKHDWIAFSAEWSPESRTYMGQIVKKFYLDELPQLYSVLKGDMSIVGPRPLSVMHYERDLAQGNLPRKLLKGGLLGLGHIKKGTEEMGNPTYEYEYVEHYINKSDWQLLKLDVWIICKGLQLIIKGGGL